MAEYILTEVSGLYKIGGGACGSSGLQNSAADDARRALVAHRARDAMMTVIGVAVALELAKEDRRGEATGCGFLDDSTLIVVS